MQRLINNQWSAETREGVARAERLYRSYASQRSGVAIMWLIAAAPAVLIMLCVMVEVGHILNARVKLEVALESAALAGVKTWADLSAADAHAAPGALVKTSAARDAAVAAALANPISGTDITLDRNEMNTALYGNANCTGVTADIVLGGFPAGGTAFNASAVVSCGGAYVDFAVLAQDTFSVTAICQNLFGVPIGPFTVSGRSIATSRCSGGGSMTVENPQLVRVISVTCP
jgi:Flp pilus assembly protein TadG